MNESSFVCTVKCFEVLLSNTHYSIYQVFLSNTNNLHTAVWINKNFSMIYLGLLSLVFDPWMRLIDTTTESNGNETNRYYH